MVSGWWIVKVACGVALAAHVAAAFTGLYAPRTLVEIPRLVGQVLVVLGAGITLWHFWILKSCSGDLSNPPRLIDDRGLFHIVRHPMYLGDTILYAGLALLTADPVGIGLAFAGIVAILAQCRMEDSAMSGKFGERHDAWRRRTAMLVPYARPR